MLRKPETLQYQQLNHNWNADPNTPDQFLQYIRLNLSTLIDSNDPLFVPHSSLPGENTWWLTNTLGSILAINITGNKGSVVVSGYSNDYWTFSTIHDPKYGDHPVSDNRTFGYRVFVLR